MRDCSFTWLLEGNSVLKGSLKDCPRIERLTADLYDRRQMATAAHHQTLRPPQQPPVTIYSAALLLLSKDRAILRRTSAGEELIY